MRVLIICGHGEGDPGACATVNSKSYKEYEITRELGHLLQDDLLNHNIMTVLYDTSKNAVKRIRAGEKINVKDFKYVVEIHFNASSSVDSIGDGKKKGTMIYIDKSETGHSVEDAILDELYAIGANKVWDGIVVTQRQFTGGLVVQNHIRAQGVSHALLETCFITDADDMSWYEENKKEIAAAIRRGIVKGFKLKNTFNSYMVRVTDSALNIREKADPTSKINGVITDHGCYTIVDESMYKDGCVWGKLKSGAGWINLKYTKKV